MPDETWTETFVHNKIEYKITWRPRPGVVYSMHQQGEPKRARQALLAARAFRRKNSERIAALRRRH